MTIEELKGIIADLSKSQGMYGRMYKQLDESDSWEKLLELVNEHKCKDVIDVTMLIEG